MAGPTQYCSGTATEVTGNSGPGGVTPRAQLVEPSWPLTAAGVADVRRAGRLLAQPRTAGVSPMGEEVPGGRRSGADPEADGAAAETSRLFFDGLEQPAAKTLATSGRFQPESLAGWR